MTVEDALREAVLALAPELAARVREELDAPRLLPIKKAPVAYRALLAAERAGELAVYRVGHSSFVDEAELFAWIKRTGARSREAAADDVHDEIGELIELGDGRRRGLRR